jgi:hypothetical protein
MFMAGVSVDQNVNYRLPGAWTVLRQSRASPGVRVHSRIIVAFGNAALFDSAH